MQREESFTLRNDPPRPKPQRFDDSDKTRQGVLFVGLDDLAGQTYLWELDGERDDAK